MKEIARFYDPDEAQVAAGFLRAQGFDVEVADVHMLTARPELRFALGGFRLLAANKDAQEAQNELAARRKSSPFPPCPNCQSTDVRRRRANIFPAVFLLAGHLLPFAPATNKLRCGRCDKTWEETDDEPSNDI